MDPVIVFFFFGILAGLLKCDFKMNESFSELVTFMLLLTIGLKGGMELHQQNLLEIVPKISAVAMLGLLIPLLAFPFLLKIGRLKRVDAAAVAAHYGSVSVGTFAVCIAYLNSQGVAFEPYAPLFVIILEVPAIIVGLLIAREHSEKSSQLFSHFKEALRSRAVTLLFGGLVIGWIIGKEALAPYNALFVNTFSGFLALFLMDMGFVVSQQLGEVKKHGAFILIFGIFMPIVSGSIAMVIANIAGLSLGGTVVVTILGASASYIAVPAALRVSLPEANLGLSLGSSLGITFPFNVIVGIPLAYQVAQFLS